MKKKLNWILCIIAAVSILAAGAGTAAYAYFTSYALTDGTYPQIQGQRITEGFP